MSRAVTLAAAVCAALALAAGGAHAQDAAARLARMGVEASSERLAQYAAQGDATVVRLLLQAGVDVNTADRQRQVTAMHNAAAQGHLALMAMLVERGADVDRRDWHGNTPLINAAWYGRLDAIKFLQARGARLDTVTDEGQTALSAARYSGNQAVVDYLEAQGARPAGPPRADADIPVRPTAATVQSPIQGPTILAIPAAATNGPAYNPAVFGRSPAADLEAGRIADAWTREAVGMPWTTLMLDMIVKHKINPSRGARGTALLHVAMHDAGQLAPDEMTRKVAVSAAAAQVMGYWFVAEEHGFERILARLLTLLDAGDVQRQAGLAIGKKVGAAAIAHGEADGAARGWNGVRLQWYGEGRYYGPGAWVPTPPYYYYPPDEPFAPQWRTWVLDSPAQFRPTPPAFGTARYLRDLDEVIEVQKNLTPRQREIAKFWVDGSGSVTPPGHWNRIAQDLTRKHRLDDQQTLRLFALLNVALADTFIAAWEAKYYYWTVRPVSIARKVRNHALTPAILTPPFPAYPSGHAAFSGASARILASVFPQEAASVVAMAEEAAMSRLYGGIHFRHDNEDGVTLGRTVAEATLSRLGCMGAAAASPWVAANPNPWTGAGRALPCEGMQSGVTGNSK